MEEPDKKWKQRKRGKLYEACLQKNCSVSKCPPDWDRVGESCYVWSQEELSWGEAEKHCQTLGGHLASVTSQVVLDYMHQQVG